ncbi:flavodoxin family protein [Thermotoga sp. Mc24]|uniref:flavodoxin family protein n=1 Tax=Thermotoga sp. Mc24 TaxID=1231241 RepID=UPI00068C0226|nr:flavodoxin family protein [Thermotoga sp. Mc24]
MKILVVYYTRSGHTKKVAEIIKDILKADIDEVMDRKPRKGIFGFLKAGYEATVGKTTDIIFKKDPSEYDLVVVGTPIWNGRVTPAIRTYLLKNREKIKKVAFFATCIKRYGVCLDQMQELSGCEVVAKKVIFRKMIEKDAKDFAEEIKKTLLNQEGEHGHQII